MICSYLHVVLCVCINFKANMWVSEGFMYVYIGIYVVYPFWVYFFLRSNYERLEEREVEEKYWSLYNKI